MTAIPHACVICDAALPGTLAIGATAPGLVRLHVDACWRHEELLRNELDRIITAARQQLYRGGHLALRHDEHPGEIRAWARHQGISCSPIGPLSSRLVTAYRQAHGTARAGDAGRDEDRSDHLTTAT